MKAVAVNETDLQRKGYQLKNGLIDIRERGFPYVGGVPETQDRGRQGWD